MLKWDLELLKWDLDVAKLVLGLLKWDLDVLKWDLEVVEMGFGRWDGKINENWCQNWPNKLEKFGLSNN